MKKIRYYLAIIGLAATLTVSAVLGIGSQAMANTASSWHASSHFAAGQSAKSVAFKLNPPCSTGGGYDC